MSHDITNISHASNVHSVVIVFLFLFMYLHTMLDLFFKFVSAIHDFIIITYTCTCQAARKLFHMQCYTYIYIHEHYYVYNYIHTCTYICFAVHVYVLIVYGANVYTFGV